MKEKLRGVGIKMTSPHYKMERMSILFGVVGLIFTMTLISGLIQDIKANNELMGDQAVYTTEFSTSLTDISGDVVNVYSNESNTKSVVLLEFDSMKELSIDASDYQMFVTGLTPTGHHDKLKDSDSITGGITIYGNSGYMAVYLENPEVFDEELVSLTIRSNQELVARENNEVDLTPYGGDESFAEYDQFRILFNPSASESVKLGSLEDEELDMAKFYEEAVVKPAESEIEMRLDESLEEMRLNLKNIDEYEKRLTTDGVALPGRPVQIEGDTVTDLNGEEVNLAAETDSEISSESDNVEVNPVDEDDVVVYDYEGTRRLNSDYVFDGGINLDWQDGNVIDGYLDDLIAMSDKPNQSREQFIRGLNNASKDAYLDTGLEDYDWLLTSGESIDIKAVGGDGDTEYDTITADISTLTKEYSAYIDNKFEYETVLVSELLMLELNSDNYISKTTTNNEEGVIGIY